MKKLMSFILALAMLLTAVSALGEAAQAISEGDPFSGEWVCDRASMTIDREEEGYRVQINWGSSAWEITEWEYSCLLSGDGTRLEAMPSGTRTELVYDDNGEIVSVAEKYADGEAAFTLDADGTLLWEDAKENAGEGMKFEKTGEAPLFLDLGEALDDPGFTGVDGIDGFGHYVVVVEREGAYCRAVADVSPEVDALWEARFTGDDWDAAEAAYEEAVRLLPVAYTETLTALPKDQPELDAAVGKTMDDVQAEGYELREEGGAEEGDVTFVMAWGLYSYEFVADGSFWDYVALQEEDRTGTMTVKSARFMGVSTNAINMSMRAYGTM